MRNIYNGGMQCKAMDKGETAVMGGVETRLRGAQSAVSCRAVRIGQRT